MHITHKPVVLTSRCHLLHWVNLHDFVFQSAWSEEYINDLELLDRQGMEVDVFDRLDLSVFNQTAKLCARHPFLFFTTLSFALALALSLAFVTEATTLAKPPSPMLDKSPGA